MLNTCLVTHLLFLLLSVHLSFVVGCHETERDALLKFKRSLVHLNHSLSSWQGMDCCKWEGVGCDNVTSHINHLDLHNPYYQYDVNSNSPFAHSGPGFLQAPRLDSSLVELRYLNYLDLSLNEFQGSQIPEFIGSFKHLRYLNLSHSSFSGDVPSQLGNLTKLKTLDLSSYVLYCTNLDWVSNLVSLQYLNMSGVNISQSTMLFSMPPSLSSVQLSNCGLTNPQLFGLFSNFTGLSRIQQLDLSRNSLEGPLPHVIANMTSLTYLDLAYNRFNGSLPRIIANMISLKHLNLVENQFNGLIPLSMRNMKNLEYLYLSANSFNGVEGGAIMGILGNLCKLKTFGLSFNSVGDRIGANHKNISKCVSYDLENLELGNNNITGILPSLWKFKYLSSLHIGNNRINGSIPVDIGRLSYLVDLDLSHNSLSGSIPESLGQCNALVSIDLSSNFLQGAMSNQHLANLSRLTSLDLSFNPYLDLNFSSSWPPPFQLTKLNMGSCKVRSKFPQWIEGQTKLSMLDLSDNMMSGELPQWFSSTNLEFINISHNQLIGRIPYFSSSSLNVIDLSYNLLSGPLLHDDPSSGKNIVGTPICQLPSLEFLDLQENKITGVIPDCWGHSEHLNYINLSSNNFSGNIPMTMGLLPKLQFLKLSNNFLRGSIPPTLRNTSMLTILDLGENQLVGNIPNNWDETTHPGLQMLRLRENKLVGGIPQTLCSLPNLQLLDFAHNNLTGHIPRCFGHLTAMKSPTDTLDDFHFYEDPRDDSTMVVLKGAELQYSTTLMFVVNVDLSCNALVGSIPEEITGLSILIGLNLSHNLLTGIIPNKIGEMRSLVSLDLSNNYLSGTIPSSMSDLTSLSALKLSYNNLHGQIPTGSQLQTLNDPSSYEGNLGLCGDPLPKCRTGHVENQPIDHNSYWDNPLFYFVIFSGFATGFWGVIGSLFLKRRFRWALFQLVEKIADYLYVQVMIKLNRHRN